MIILIALSIQITNAANFHSIFLEIDQHHVGQTFLNALQIGLASGSPIHEIQSYINNIRFMLEQEQKEADMLIQNTQSQCSRLLHDFSTNYAYHNSQLLSHQKIIEENQGNLHRVLNKIAEVSVEIEENIQKNNQGQSERDLQYNEFQTRIKDHNQVITDIDDAYALVEHLANGASFIQVKSRFNTLIMRLANQRSIAHFQPILTLMAQLAAKNDNDLAKKILLLLANLRIQIVESKNNDEDLEKVASLNWQEFLNDLTNEKNTLSDQRQHLEQAILNYQSIISESSGKVEYHQIEFVRNKENVENQDIWCRQQQNIYQMESQMRGEILQFVSQIVDHIQDRIVTLKEYLRERLIN